MAMLHTDKNLTRRVFLVRSIAFVVGCTSAATGLFTLWKGKRADPFLSKDSLTVLKRFGLGQDLIDTLDLSPNEQPLLAKRIVTIIREFNAKKTLFGRNDFSQALRNAVELDFKKSEVITVSNWILSKTEVGIYIFNQMRRSGLIAS
jgi:hypothetical protein